MVSEVEMFLEDLGLIPSSLVTPAVVKLIALEWQQREFDLTVNERAYRDHYLKKLRERANIRRKRVNKPPEKTLKINF